MKTNARNASAIEARTEIQETIFNIYCKVKLHVQLAFFGIDVYFKT